MKKLVIVESPTKAKTIEKILGDDFKVFSSKGHIIDLPRRQIGVDVDQDFRPTYVVIPGKKKNLTQLKKAIKDTQIIYLATDPDREGEAISWHLKEQLQDTKRTDKQFLRVIFHEITPQAVQEAFTHPESIDLNKVNAQQARRVLDRLVGYFLSPLLWKKLAAGLSAGRVQSVALKLIVQRERQILNFKPEEYWQIRATLKRQVEKFEVFDAELEKCDGQKIKIENKTAADKIINELKKQEYVVAAVKKKEKKRHPYPPFTTSTLQQEAFNKLKFTAHKTMLIAQQLYEGIELGEQGPIGIITYMRTDSVKIADSAISQLRQFIKEEYGTDYLPAKANSYKSKGKAQEAHEAIRPTAINRSPKNIEQYLTADQYKLYELIWKRTVASQMKSAIYLSHSIDIQAGRYMFLASGSVLIFDGFLKVLAVSTEEKEGFLPELNLAEHLELVNLIPSQHFTRPPARYSEASLVKALEEKGIGRPSTYAPIIYTLLIRNYIRREKGYIVCTELGIKVNDILVEYFPNIIDVGFTASMEEELDKVEEGTLNWVAVLRDFYLPFKDKLSYAQENLKKEIIYTKQICELCGQPMVIKWSKMGKFLSCSAFPKCRNAKSISSGVKCPAADCGGELVMRRSKRGLRFYGCSNYPKCRYVTKFLPKSDDKQTTQQKSSTDSEKS